MSNINDLSVAQLKQAIEIREQIEALEAELSKIGLGRQSASTTTTEAKPPARRGRPPGKRRMSAAGRASVAAAAKARWAKYRTTKGGSDKSSSTAEKPARKKRRFSPAARAKLKAAAQARWARAKAAGKTTL